MHVSKYTFLFDYEGNEYYVYNSLSNALIEIDKESYDILIEKKKTKNCIQKLDLDEELHQVLSDNGILTLNDKDDFLRYKSIIMGQRMQQKAMHLTIAPTMDCCFQCHYCFEEYKEKGVMSPDTMDSIIQYVIDVKQPERIDLTWFGGEPLMAVAQIESFYNKIKLKYKGPILSNMITTGFHLSPEIINAIKSVEVREIQITLDGMRETHNKVKHVAGVKDVFQKVIDNILLLMKLAPDIFIVIRVNLTKSNANEYVELCYYLYELFKGRTNFVIAPAFVLDRGVSSQSSTSSELFNHKERSEYILELTTKHNLDSPFIRYPHRFFNECAIRNDMAISFDAQGYAYKCWELIGNKKFAIGKIDSQGLLAEINLVNFNRQTYGADHLDDQKCIKCDHMPICNGGCPIQRIQNEYEDGKNCLCVPQKGYLIDFLRLHIAFKKAGYHNRIL